MIISTLDIKAKDCQELYSSGKRVSGVYKISIDTLKPISVYCDMDTDGGGWTVIQRRRDGTTNFDTQGWRSYKQGFGDKTNNFWLGLDMIHKLTAKGVTFRVDITYLHTEKRQFAKYNTFRVGNEVSGYRLQVAGYSGNAGDHLQYHNGMRFSTKDRDNDKWPSNCAVTYGNAWWHKACVNSNLNGKFPIGRRGSSQNMRWGSYIKFSEMKIR